MTRAWIASGAAVTIKTYARCHGVDRYTAYEDLTAIGFPLPDSAQRWAHRPPPQPRPRRSATRPALPDNDQIMMDGRTSSRGTPQAELRMASTSTR